MKEIKNWCDTCDHNYDEGCRHHGKEERPSCYLNFLEDVPGRLHHVTLDFLLKGSDGVDYKKSISLDLDFQTAAEASAFLARIESSGTGFVSAKEI